MNLPLRQAASQRGDNRAGGDGIGTVANPPAQPLVVGSVGFGPAWTTEDSMAASIVRLQHQLEEANARIALLEEEQRILAKGHQGHAKAAVIEGGTGFSGAERPEPSPHLSIGGREMSERLTPETEALLSDQSFDCVPYDEAAGQLADLARKLERERDEARADADEWQKKYAEVFVERDRVREALKRIADCDWVITLPDRMDAVRKIARDALEAAK